MDNNYSRGRICAKGKFKDGSGLNNLRNKSALDRFCENFDRIPIGEIEDLLDKYNCI